MTWLRRLSIRARITVQTLAVALVLCSVAVVLFRLNVESVVRAATVQLIENDAGPFEVAIRHNPANPTVMVAEDQLVAIIAPDGRVVTSSLPHRLRGSLRALEKLGTTARPISAGSHTYLARQEAVRTSSGTWNIVSVRDQEQGDLVLQRLTLTLLTGGLILVLGFGLAAWLLTGAALRPVNIMRRDAERLSASASLEALPLGVARDELSRLAGTLNAFIERNRQTIEREKQMLSDASHELRTPIAILSAQLELAASPGRDLATMRRELAGARRTSARLATLTTNLLELAKIETGHRQEPTPWRSLVQELAASIDRARLLAQPRGISVDFEVLGIDDEAQSYALSGVSFASAIDNLLVNAIAATPREGVVHVGVVQGMNGLILTVTDTGRGMPAEFIPIAFDRFTRPDGSRQRALGGSGLGLAIVHAIATAAGGTARIENRDPGLAVMVELPKAGFTPPAG
ncbi:MAG TPA: HAMP domain-containing sensor histidine kinase [Galbitalea sp.]